MATEMTDVKDIPNTEEVVVDKVVEGETVEETSSKPPETEAPKKNKEGVTGQFSKAADDVRQSASKAADDVRQSASKTINDALKQVESIGKALGSALQDRSNVVMVRINNDALHFLDMMVEADVAKSRSEGAAFLINEGIKSNEDLFHKIRDISDQISALKSKLRETIKTDD
jgi:hypothetical protein